MPNPVDIYLPNPGRVLQAVGPNPVESHMPDTGRVLQAVGEASAGSASVSTDPTHVSVAILCGL